MNAPKDAGHAAVDAQTVPLLETKALRSRVRELEAQLAASALQVAKKRRRRA